MAGVGCRLVKPKIGENSGPQRNFCINEMIGRLFKMDGLKCPRHPGTALPWEYYSLSPKLTRTLY